MNKDNFQKLIDAILQDGQFRFNMGCFIGKLVFEDDNDLELVKNGSVLASNYEISSLQEINTTDLFNCDSVGCIAGFATALAHDWKTPDWIKESKDDSLESIQNLRAYNLVDSFEDTANTFLGLTKEQGRRLYYGDSDTVWKYLKYFEPYLYADLKYIGEDDYEADEILNQEVNWDCEDYDIHLGSVGYKTAAYVLTKIMNDEILIDKDSGDITVNELQTSNEKG